MTKRRWIIIPILALVALTAIILGVSRKDNSSAQKQLEKALIIGDLGTARRIVLHHLGLLFVWNEAKLRGFDLREEFGQAIRENDSVKVKQMLAKEPALLEAFVPHHFKLKDYGLTPLMVAAARGNKAVVEVLLEHGANMEARTHHGVTALGFARHNKEIAELLLTHGADVNGCRVADLTLLQDAVVYEKVEIARVLLAHGADPNLKDDSGEIPLLRAVDFGNLGMVKLLLVHRADVNARSTNGVTALMLAKDPAVKELLLQNGAKE